MNSTKIESEKFDRAFKKLLKIKRGKNVVRGRFDLEDLVFKSKGDFIIQMIATLSKVSTIICKISFWEKNELIREFLKSRNKKFEITTTYKNGKSPGVVFIEDLRIDKIFLKTLLSTHFNHEMGYEPSINIRLQICIDKKEDQILFDIYDDRGFDVYYVKG